VTALVAAGEHDAVRGAVAFLAARDGDGGGPFVALVEALLAAETGAVAEVERHLARANAGWPPAPRPALGALQVLVQSRAAGMSGDADRMRRAAVELDAVVPRADPELVAMGRLDTAILEVMSGRADAARRLAEDVLADAREHQHGYLVARALAVLASLAGAVGDYGRMAQMGEQAHEQLARGRWQATSGAELTTTVRAYAALLDLRPVRCLSLLGPPLPAGSGTDALDPMAVAMRAAALADLGRGGEAGPELRLAQAALGTQPAPVQLIATAALLVHGSATDLGHHDVAAEVARRAEDVLGPTGEVALMRARREASGARRDRSTAAALRSVLDGTTPVVVPWTRIEAGVVLCGLALADGRRPQARHELDRALQAAATSGAVRPLVAGGPAVLDLLARQLGSFGAGDAVGERVLSHRGFDGPDDVALTDRERDVLALLETSRSLREIAAQLEVAPSTVKTHLRAVYGKLGVTSRRAAVAAGRRRGVLVGSREGT
jgi:LuxR family maltose regulon positive regulatory protein